MSDGISSTSLINSNTLSLRSNQNATEADNNAVQSNENAQSPAPNPQPSDSVSTANTENTANNINRILDGISLSRQVVEQAQSNVSTISEITQEIQGLIVQAQQEGFSVNIQNQINALLSQIDDLVDNGTARGVNLLDGDDLETVFSENGRSNLITQGEDLNTDALLLQTLTEFDESSANSLLNNLNRTTEILEAFEQRLSESLNTIQTRQDFAQETLGSLEAGTEALQNNVNTDEAANLLALQIGQQLSESSESLATNSQRDLLRLF